MHELRRDGTPHKIKALHLLARKLVDRAMEGDVAALREIGDRLDGRPSQELTLQREANPFDGISDADLATMLAAARHLVPLERQSDKPLIDNDSATGLEVETLPIDATHNDGGSDKSSK